MKILYLCRHAKSSWQDVSCADIDRRLNKRGKRDAPLMGKRLFNAGVRPDGIISSPAVRARKTAGHFAKKMAYPKGKIIINDRLYATSVDYLISCIKKLDDVLQRVFLVGHNSEITMCANMLANADIFNVPTCGVVAVEFHVLSWQEIRVGQGKLLFFDFPKNKSC